MSIYQKFKRKNNVSFKSESSYQQKNLSKTPVYFFVFVSLLIATYFLLTHFRSMSHFYTPLKTSENPGPSYDGAYQIKKAVQGTFRQGNTRKYSLWKAIEIN